MASKTDTREMYRVKPYYGSEVLETKSGVMYKTENLHTDVTNTIHISKESLVTGDNPAAELEQRQELILKKLQDLKEVVSGLRRRYGTVHTSNCGSSSSSVSATRSSNVTTSSLLQGDVLLDLVISVNPNSPPLSLFVLYELLKQQYKVGAKTYVHSSAVNVPEKLTSIFTNDGTKERGDNHLMITVIWKDVSNGPTLMVEPHRQTPIIGESNIARYLMRLLNPNYDTDDIAKVTQIDEWLDTANIQVLQGNTKEKSAAVRSLNSRLGRNDWLVGSRLSLADIVMWSALNQSNQVSDAPANVKKWLKLCSSNSAFKSCL
ncbi:hypothetical protein KUTeg_004421 [Tegillarca granosa]|uniref:Aminoacyl tRNA synthase complex-interacting multifunctional protein 2 n=1 Tax=Tegillarca granosa TaxID=220873 RepID=A0ABQ9FSS7_TEGGR|nr:hypothetical protein KUTeg_004421 [Tegillarca granosa]